jgi:glycosidase
MQLFGRGLRRRLPPMLDGDAARIRLVYSLLFSLPGTPVLFYGEEIGMGENLDVPGRLSVRTPMQWADEPNGGFSTARPGRLPRPVVEGEFGPLAVNVAGQRRDPDSLLNWMERMIRRRRECPEFGWGTMTLLDASDDAVLAHRCDWEGTPVVAVHNLGAEPRAIKVDLGDTADADRVVDLLSVTDPVHPLDASSLELKLEGYGYRWYRLQRRDTPLTP